MIFGMKDIILLFFLLMSLSGYAGFTGLPRWFSGKEYA